MKGLKRIPPGVAFGAVCVLLALLFYAEFVFHPEFMLFGTDMLDQAYQLRKFAVEEIRAGRGFPLWNPFVYSGLPFLAILPGPVFYPTSLLYLVLPLYRAIGWTFVIHTAMAGIFAWYAARSLRLGPWASAAAGLAFMFTGFVVSKLYGGHDGRMFAMVLMPLAFAFLERGLRSGRAGWFLGMGLVVALQIFTPHVQVMYYSSLALCLYALFRIIQIWRAGDGERKRAGAGAAKRKRAGGGKPAAAGGRNRAGVRDRKGKRADAAGRSPAAAHSLADEPPAVELARAAALRRAGLVALGFVVAALVGSIQLLSTLRILDIAVRGSPGESGYAFAASWALPVQELTALWLPDLIGSLDPRVGGSYWGANPFKLHIEYLGAVPLALVAIALSSVRKDARVLALAAISLLGVLFALGAATPVHRITYWIVPMISRFRAPSMMLGPVALFVALLAGLGWQRVMDARRSGTALPWAWIWIGSAPFLLLALAAALSPEGLLRWAYLGWFPAGWPKSPPETLTGTLRATGVLVLLGWGGTLAVGQAVASRRLPVAAFAAVLAVMVADLWRVDARYLLTVDPDVVFAPDDVVRHMQADLEPGERVFPLPGSYRPNELMTWRVPSVTGVQNFRIAWYDRLVGGLSYANLARPIVWGLTDLRYLTVPASGEPLEHPLLELSAEASPTGFSEELPGAAAALAGTPAGVRAYGVRADVPHAFFPERVEVARDTAEALRRVLAFEDPRSLALVAGTGEGSAASVGRPPGAGAGSARVVEYGADELTLEVEAERGGLLFVSDVYHPSWRAFVDGEPAEIWRTNVAFRGVEVPAGFHRVHLVYAAGEFTLGFLLSGGALAATLIAIVWLDARGRRDRPEEAVARAPAGP